MKIEIGATYRAKDTFRVMDILVLKKGEVVTIVSNNDSIEGVFELSNGEDIFRNEIYEFLEPTHSTLLRWRLNNEE